MQSYTDGYVTAFPYTYGYYGELNPLRAALPILRLGYAFPKINTACELGFGQGLSININAAASAIDWWGTDFNPCQVDFARSLADASEANPKLFDEAFTDFCYRKDLPIFEFVGIHGIWSWISDENKAAIIHFIKNKLAVGGILYISYNCLPGWAPMVPLRTMLALYEKVAGSAATLKNNIDAAIDFALELDEQGAKYMKLQPSLKNRLESMRKQDHTYLAHEYFNQNWDVQGFEGNAKWLSSAMLDYVCQANFYDTVNTLNLSEQQIAVLNKIDDIVLKESARDIMVNTQFRRDYWIKGRRELAPLQLKKCAMDLKFVMTVEREKVELTAKGLRGEARLAPDIYNPVLDILADNKIHALDEISKNAPQITLPQLLEAITILCGKSVVSPAQDYNSNIKKQIKRLNGAIEDIACSSSNIKFLASPVLGGGYALDRFSQIFLLAKRSCIDAPADMAKFAWQQLSAANQKIIKDDVTLETEEENLTELEAKAQEFVTKKLPLLEKLYIC